MIPFQRPPPSPEEDQRIQPREEPPHSRTEALEKAIYEAYYGENEIIQTRGCEAVLSLAIPLVDKENKKNPVENWEIWRNNAVQQWQTAMSFAVPAADMNKEGRPTIELHPVGGASDSSKWISYVPYQLVDGQREHLVRGQYRRALTVLKLLVGELIDVLTERMVLKDRDEVFDKEAEDELSLSSETSPLTILRPPVEASEDLEDEELDEEEEDDSGGDEDDPEKDD